MVYDGEGRRMATALDALLTQTSDTCGGRMRINGTRITVSRVATLYKQGMTAEDIATTYSHLSLGAGVRRAGVLPRKPTGDRGGNVASGCDLRQLERRVGCRAT